MSLTLNTTSVNDVLSAVRQDAEANRKREGVAFAWTGILRRVVHLITRSTKHDVSLVTEGWQPAPAWTNGTDIYLSSRILDPYHRWGTDDPAELVVRLKGAVYHELAHILYSPRIGHPLRNAVANEHLHYVWNILEDGRIESIFSRRFPRAASYFKLLVVRWLLANGVDNDAGNDACTPLLVIGRRHLPRRLRDDAYRRLTAVAGQAVADELVAQVSLFHSTSVEDWEAQLACVREVGRILNDLNQSDQPEPPVGDGHNGQREGKPEDPDANDDGDDGDWSFDPSDDEGEDDGTTDDTDGEGSGSTGDDDTDADHDLPDGEGDPTDEDGEDGSGAADGDDTPEGDADADGGDGDSDGGTDGADTDGADGDTGGSGAGGGVSDHTDDDVQPIDWDAELAEAEAEVSEDISQTIDAVKAEAEQTNGGSGQVSHRTRAVDADARLVQSRVKDALSQLRNDTAPEPQPRQRAGRLDTRRYLDPHRLPHELDTFRNVTTGEGFDTELVILLDVSGSMKHRIGTAAQALWALATAADGEGIPTSVVTFAHDGEWSLWKGPNDRWDNGTLNVPVAKGGTNPDQPLLWAVDYLTASSHDRKLLVTITDGMWNGSEDVYRAIYSEADKQGIQSLCIGIGGVDVVSPLYSGYPDGGHGAGATANAATILDIPSLVQGWVDTIVRS